MYYFLTIVKQIIIFKKIINYKQVNNENRKWHQKKVLQLQLLF